MKLKLNETRDILSVEEFMTIGHLCTFVCTESYTGTYSFHVDLVERVVRLAQNDRMNYIEKSDVGYDFTGINVPKITKGIKLSIHDTSHFRSCIDKLSKLYPRHYYINLDIRFDKHPFVPADIVVKNSKTKATELIYRATMLGYFNNIKQCLEDRGIYATTFSKE